MIYIFLDLDKDDKEPPGGFLHHQNDTGYLNKFGTFFTQIKTNRMPLFYQKATVQKIEQLIRNKIANVSISIGNCRNSWKQCPFSGTIKLVNKT